jgi:predicted transcriptional regulator
MLEMVKVLFEHDYGLHEAELYNALNLTQDEIRRIASTLIDQGYISESSQKYVLTFKGWQFFIVVSHLIWFQNLKLEPSKALKIVPAFQEVFEIQWGEFLGKDEDAALKELRDKGWLKRLTDEGVIEEDIRKAIYEHNYIPEE